MGRPFKCPCGSTDTTSKGFRRTKTLGVRRIRRCRGCGRKFTPRNQQPLEVVPEAQSATPEQGGAEPAAPAGEPPPGSVPPS